MARFRVAGVIVALACVAVADGGRADAGSLEACAQRMIRDWYSGGRVDGIYPLACYRAAIRALPEDVLQYSNADRDIARALAYARRGRTDPTPASSTAESAAAPPPQARTETPEARAETVPASAAAPAPERPGAPAVRRDDRRARLAAGPEAETASAPLPYPVIALAALAGVLLLTGGASWLASRRR